MKKTGTLLSLNVSPKGFYEGFLLNTGKGVVQVNLHKEHLHGFSQGWPAGSPISVEVEAEEPWGEPAHKVFRLVRIIGEGDDDSGKARTFSGRVARLNYALHGEVNGGILESGDFLHLKPEGARAVGITAGMLIKARGKAKPMADGKVVIEAEEINSVALIDPK